MLSILGVLIIVALSLWFSYERGRVAGGYDAFAAAARVGELERLLSELQSDMANMQSNNTALERNNHIEKDANKQVEETIVKLQDEILRLNEEVTFYRSIVSPQEAKHRLFIQELQFVRKSADDYKYKVMVTQKGNNTRVVRGIVRITFDGLKDGKTTSLKMEDMVTSTENKKFKLGFKYFQVIEGIAKIPEGFVPSTLRIQVVPNGSRLADIDKVVEWATVNSEGEKVNVGQ
ncbi:MAG: hypothetical protein OEY29_15085 [Gammaproteobacteria bacterium]|nr:hypothetical protein [Gammaproteobacteria bacterium]